MPVDEQGREYSEDWEFGSGLQDDFDGTIVKSEFGYDEKYEEKSNTHQVLFIATIQPDDGSDVVRKLFSCGADFEPVEGGKAIAKPNGGPIIKTSAYGRLCLAAQTLFPDFRLRGSPKRVGMFDGTGWHWKMTEYKFVSRGEERTTEALMPIKFLGVKSGAAAAGSGSSGGASSGGDIRDEITALAITNDTHATFLKSIVSNKELNERVKAAGLMREVIDSKDTGFFAKARKEAGV